MANGVFGPYLKDVSVVWDLVRSPDAYPFALPAVRALDALPLHPKVTFFVGENGTGKSTLLEAIAVACDMNPEGGSRNFAFATRASHSGLGESLRLSRSFVAPRDTYFLRAETFYNVATEIERLDEGTGEVARAYGGRGLHEQSHGESFFALFQDRLSGRGLYLLDEPEAALSPSRQMSFLSIMHDYCRGGAQFVVATHSPIIMAYPDSWIYVLDGSGVERTPYEETEHVRVTRAFLGRTEQMLAMLLDP